LIFDLWHKLKAHKRKLKPRWIILPSFSAFFFATTLELPTYAIGNELAGRFVGMRNLHISFWCFFSTIIALVLSEMCLHLHTYGRK